MGNSCREDGRGEDFGGGVWALTKEFWVQLWGGYEGEVGMTDSFL